MALTVDLEPVKIEVLDKNRRTGEVTKYSVWIREFSEADVKVRTQLIRDPGPSEDSRRGRQQRNQQQAHIERIRLFNFERGVVKWDFVFPEDYWDENEERRKPHPRAGETMPINRETFEIIPERIMDQIQEEINALNEPPQELPEVRDQDGKVTQKEEHSPLVANSAGRSEQL